MIESLWKQVFDVDDTFSFGFRKSSDSTNQNLQFDRLACVPCPCSSFFGRWKSLTNALNVRDVTILRLFHEVQIHKPKTQNNVANFSNYRGLNNLAPLWHRADKDRAALLAPLTKRYPLVTQMTQNKR